jgi:hypothetical protein
MWRLPISGSRRLRRSSPRSGRPRSTRRNSSRNSTSDRMTRRMRTPPSNRTHTRRARRNSRRSSGKCGCSSRRRSGLDTRLARAGPRPRGRDSNYSPAYTSCPFAPGAGPRCHRSPNRTTRRPCRGTQLLPPSIEQNGASRFASAGVETAPASPAAEREQPNDGERVLKRPPSGAAHIATSTRRTRRGPSCVGPIDLVHHLRRHSPSPSPWASCVQCACTQANGGKPKIRPRQSGHDPSARPMARPHRPTDRPEPSADSLRPGPRLRAYATKR